MSDKAISLVTAEWEALSGLPYLQFKLYVVLRWYMSVATRRVGDVRGISLQGLCEEAYIEPAPGRSESGSPTKKAVRSALQQLEKHGLVQPCGNGEVLVFFLPKAGGKEARPNSKGHKRGTANGQVLGHGETPTPQGFPGEKGQAMGQGENPIKGHTSEVRVNPLSEETSAAFCSREKLSTGRVSVLPLRVEMADLIRTWERQREKVARVSSTDEILLRWESIGLSGAVLREAYDMAVVSREVTKNPAPINLGFLDVFVQQVLNGSLAARSAGAPRQQHWSMSEAGIVAKAEEFGIERRDGEAIAVLRGRVELEEIIRIDQAKAARKATSKRKAG